MFKIDKENWIIRITIGFSFTGKIVFYLRHRNKILLNKFKDPKKVWIYHLNYHTPNDIKNSKLFDTGGFINYV